MNFKMVYKVGLDKKQIEAVNKMNFIKFVEIQMIKMDDDLDLIHLLKKKIINIHLPLDNNAYDISCVLDAIRKKNKYYENLIELFKLKEKYKFRIVAHANTSFENLEKFGVWNEFINLTQTYKLIWRLENTIAKIENTVWKKKRKDGTSTFLDSSETNIMSYPLALSERINATLKEINSKDVSYGAYPLLDICHYQMNRNHFNCSFEYNLQDTLDIYDSKDFHIHFNNALGCGINKQGGVHDSNFEEDIFFLQDIIKYLKEKKDHITLILEVKEKNHFTKENAYKLERMIKKI